MLRTWHGIVEYPLDFRCVIKGTLEGFGLGPKDVEIGDRIAILEGSGVPVILRDLHRAQVPTYRVTEQCFYQKLMHGEAVDWPVSGGESMILE
jgi:hypothetical protein